MIYEQNENANKDKNDKKEPNRNFGTEMYITGMRKLLEFNRFEQSNEKIRKLENRTIVIIQFGKQKEKRMKSEHSLRDLWDTIKHTNIHIMGVPEGEGRKDQKDYLKN